MSETLDVFKAFSDKTRVRILFLLMEKELCVCELTFILKMEQSRVSHQLRILRESDLIQDTREKRWIIYSIAPGKREMLNKIFQELFPQIKKSFEVQKDIENLEICLKKGVRQVCQLPQTQAHL